MWMAVAGLGPAEMDALTRAAPVYDSLRDVAIVVTDGAGMPELEALAASLHGRIVPIAAEAQDKALLLADDAPALVGALHLMKLAQTVEITSTISALVIAVADLPAVQEVSIGMRVDLMSVSTSRRIPARPREQSRAFLISQNRNYSATVQELVDSVSTANLESTVETLSSFPTRYSQSTSVRDARDWLVAQLQALGLSVELHFFRNNYAENIIATLPGETSDLVICGAHYDSIPSSGAAPGADDNGSGSSALLELARIFATSGKRFRNTLRFGFWCGEEQGLYGSAAYANELFANGTDIVAYLNADMLGYRIPGTNPVLAMKSQSSTQWLNEYAIELTEMYVPQVNTGYSSSCCSDWISFYNRGYDSIGYFENVQSASAYPCYHRTCDLPSEVDFNQVTLHTKGFLAGVATMAEPL
eukprot:TRINITY_DN1184_c0_g1_i1.p1 TRINITY_DN1184_c0_g1~~TRINITY_DN1184_c0_g1_i1.p1  ORF type:complete len:441 (-),score=119.81 TRINITY_DN1184_c0_g1_i1:45-1295(-)